MNNVMNIIINNEKYRVVEIKKQHTIDYGYAELLMSVNSYKVQIQVWLFWITIKEFEEEVYDNDSEFCKREAVELYNKIVNPYG